MVRAALARGGRSAIRRTLFANDRIPLAAVPVHHTDRKPALYPTSAASGWPPSLLRCSAFALFSCVLSVILTEERLLQFQLRQDRQTISPLLANIYLHYVLDEWFEHEVKPRLKGGSTRDTFRR